MKQNLYRIIDTTTDETVAQGIDTFALATETQRLYEQDYPHSKFEIETYLQEQ